MTLVIRFRRDAGYARYYLTGKRVAWPQEASASCLDSLGPWRISKAHAHVPAALPHRCLVLEFLGVEEIMFGREGGPDQIASADQCRFL